MGTEERRLALIINTAAYDRVAFALNVASAGAASGQEVSLLFGYGGLLRLKRSCSDQLGEETDRRARQQIEAGLAKGTGEPPRAPC